MADSKMTEAAQAALSAIPADLTAAHARIAELEARGDALAGALREAERAIAEYYRYWTGGETRGSYDGKPERQGLWNAREQNRVALTAWESSR